MSQKDWHLKMIVFIFNLLSFRANKTNIHVLKDCYILTSQVGTSRRLFSRVMVTSGTQRLAFVFSLCVTGSDTLPIDTAEIIWKLHALRLLYREIRVPLQTCIVSNRNLFMYPFRQHRIEPQGQASPWFRTSLL